MKIWKTFFLAATMLATGSAAWAGQAPGAVSSPDIPISHHDRVYAAEQFSNTVSVTDPVDNELLGVIRLGDPQPVNFSPLYKGQVLVHGMGYSPDHRTLAVVSIGSNSVTFIDTATNSVKHVTYVGRSPHEAFFTPDGKEVWVTVRGENYISVLDTQNFEEKTRIVTPNGPGMQIFSPDGKYGYICSSFNPETDVVSVDDHKIIAKVKQESPFCPNIAATPEGDQVWFTLKDTGKTQVFNARPPFNPIKTIDTGPITNHVNFAHTANGTFAYVTVGGLNEVKVFRTDDFSQVATIPVGNLPHGLWPSGDGSRVYVALENGEMAVAIDTLSNKVIANIPIGQTTQALVDVPNAVPTGSGTDNLVPLGEAGNTARLHLQAAGTALPDAQASVAVNSLGLLDLMQIAAAGLAPKSQYQVYLAESDHAPFGKLEPLAVLKTNPDGAGSVQAIGPLKSLASGTGAAASVPLRRFLIVSELHDPAQVVLRQASASSGP